MNREDILHMALDALEDLVSTLDDDRAFMTSALSTITALRAALEEQAEPLQGGLTDFEIRAWKMGYDAAKAEQAEPVAEPVQVTYAMVEAAEAAHDAARGLQGGFWRSAVPAMIKAALAAKQQSETVEKNT
jgi:hypothetical protein